MPFRFLYFQERPRQGGGFPATPHDVVPGSPLRLHFQAQKEPQRILSAIPCPAICFRFMGYSVKPEILRSRLRGLLRCLRRDFGRKWAHSAPTSLRKICGRSRAPPPAFHCASRRRLRFFFNADPHQACSRKCLVKRRQACKSNLSIIY